MIDFDVISSWIKALEKAFEDPEWEVVEMSREDLGKVREALIKLVSYLERNEDDGK